MMKNSTYRHIFGLYCVMLIACAFPYWAKGEVLVPSCHAVVMGVVAMTPSQKACEQRKFTDFENDFLPEVMNQLTAPRTGFMAVQFADNELGRQTRNVAGKTPANLYTWAIFQVSHDAYQILTILALSMAFLAGVFVLLVCRELQLTPIAGLVGAVFMATNPFMLYWLPFPMHIASLCWSAGLFWGIVRMHRRNDAIAWGVIAFSTYSLLMMGYLQTGIYSVWMLVGYVGWLGWGYSRRQQWGAFGLFCVKIGIAGVIGVLLAMPVYIDLWQQYRISTQPRNLDEFFTHFIAQIDTWDSLRIHLSARSNPELFGNPMAGVYPMEFDGLSIPLVYVTPLILAVVMRWRHVWWWVVWAVVLVALSVSVPLFTLWMRVIPGFRFSQWAPIWSSVIPIALIVAYGSDVITTQVQLPLVRRLIGWGVIGSSMLIAVNIWVGLQFDFAIHYEIVAICAGLLVGYMSFLWRPQLIVLVIMLIITLGYSAYPMLLHQPRAALVQDSEIVDVIRQYVVPGSRYAVVATELADIMAPNYNATQGLASVHSYHNFTSFYYQNFLRQLGGKSVSFGRLNRIVAPNYDTTTFWMSNIRLVLSAQPIDDQRIVLVKKINKALLYHVKQSMGMYWRIPVQLRPGISDIRIDDYHSRTPLAVNSYDNQGDVFHMTYPTVPTPTLMVLSRQYDVLWSAEYFDGTQWHATQIVSVNGVYMGVYLPANSQAIRLTYHTYVQYMWISHLIWVLMIGLVCSLWIKNKAYDVQSRRPLRYDAA